MKAEKVIRYRRGKLSYIYPADQKEQIVLELEAGDVGISEILVKYSITLPTLQSWVKAYGKTGQLPCVMSNHTRNEKRKIVNEIAIGRLTMGEAIRRYKVSKSTLYLWRKQYGYEIASTQASGPMDQQRHSSYPIRESRQIEEMKLKIAALETMIDEAEREFNIPIRKKSGSKQ